jgi:hypothetical protein
MIIIHNQQNIIAGGITPPAGDYFFALTYFKGDNIYNAFLTSAQFPQVCVQCPTDINASDASGNPVVIPVDEVLAGFFGTMFNLTTIPNNFFWGFGNLRFINQIPNVTSIGNSVFYNCYRLNYPITIPMGMLSIGNSFLGNCSVFNQPITLPDGLQSIGDGLLVNAVNYVNTITVNTALTNAGSTETLATPNSTALQYTQGIKIAGAWAAQFKALYPDRSSTPYRKLILA